jgi:hypothetical protein
MRRGAKGRKTFSEISRATGASRTLMIAGLLWVFPACVQLAAQALSSSPLLVEAQAQGEERPAAGPGPVVHVVATLNLAKHTGSILHVTPLASARSRPALGDRVELVVRDAAGQALYRLPVAMEATANIPQGKDQTALIDVAIPFHQRMAEIDLMWEGTVVAWYKGGQKRPPPVTRLRITSIPQSRRVALSWVAPPHPNPRLTFTVEISENCSHWKTIVEGLNRSTLVLSETQARARWARVISSTGLRNSRPATILLKAQSRPCPNP